MSCEQRAFGGDRVERVHVKLCGTTSVADRDLAAEFGADYFGIVVDVSWSPRSVTPATAAELLAGAPLPGVMLFCDATLDAILAAFEQSYQPNLFAVQLQGNETAEFVGKLCRRLPCEVWKALHLPPAGSGKVDWAQVVAEAGEFLAAGAHKLLLDSVVTGGGVTKLGGTGVTHDWAVARRIVESLACPVWLSGGISPENVEEALERVRPYGVDLASGVEASKGKRDREKVRRLMEAVKNWAATKGAAPV